MSEKPARPPPATESKLPPHVLAAIYGQITTEEKEENYKKSLVHWWQEYADRKNDEEDEHVADSLLYDRSHLPRTIPAPQEWHDAGRPSLKKEEEEKKK